MGLMYLIDTLRLDPVASIKTGLRIVHFIGLALGLGAATVLDLMILKFFLRGKVTSDQWNVFHFGSRIVNAGLILLWITGLGFLAYYSAFDPIRLGNEKVWAKMTIVLILTINGIFLHMAVLPKVKAQIGRSLLDGAASLDALGTHFGAGLYAREIDWLRREEWARTADDVLWRRTKTGLHMTPAQHESVALGHVHRGQFAAAQHRCRRHPQRARIAADRLAGDVAGPARLEGGAAVAEHVHRDADARHRDVGRDRAEGRPGMGDHVPDGVERLCHHRGGHGGDAGGQLPLERRGQTRVARVLPVGVPVGLVGDLQAQPQRLAGGDALRRVGDQLGLHMRRGDDAARRGALCDDRMLCEVALTASIGPCRKRQICLRPGLLPELSGQARAL